MYVLHKDVKFSSSVMYLQKILFKYNLHLIHVSLDLTIKNYFQIFNIIKACYISTREFDTIL